MRTAALALAALVALPGCSAVTDMLYAELEVPELGVTLPAQSFPGMPVADPLTCEAAPDLCTVSTDLAYDLGEDVDLLNEPDAEYEVRVTAFGLDLTADDPGTDLGGVEAVTIEVLPPDAGEPVVVASYLRAPGAEPTSFSVTGNSNVDLAPFIRAGLLNVRVTMVFDAPTPDFTADVHGTFYVRVRLDYGQMI